ncbi:citryl-CoA lyase [Immundisolibacter sp.]|uniref:citryl-CoA lyase n=1 Tax=Immundisolibacter sp. TaxID=1934948 RepID=UPI00356A5002
MSRDKEVIHTRIWEEEPETDNPFAAAACYCHGYDVYGELLHKATFVEYLYLLFTGERPMPPQAQLLERLAIALANPGPREASVHAAMCAGVGGSPAAAMLMAAAGIGAGNLGGGHEVRVAIGVWMRLGLCLPAWQEFLADPPPPERADIWTPLEHAPGFDPHGVSCATPVLQTLTALAAIDAGPHLRWLSTHRPTLERFAKSPLAMSGVAAAALRDLGFDEDKGEMLYLFLRLPGAAVHALEQKEYGFRRFPFFHGAVKYVGPSADKA